MEGMTTVNFEDFENRPEGLAPAPDSFEWDEARVADVVLRILGDKSPALYHSAVNGLTRSFGELRDGFPVVTICDAQTGQMFGELTVDWRDVAALPSIDV
jgi:hypothetical protein